MFSFTRRKIRLDFSTNDVECIDGKAYGMKFISSDPSVWKTFLNDFVKEWREVYADDADSFPFGEWIQKEAIINRHSASIIYYVTAASHAQRIDNDLILCADVSAKFIQGNSCIQHTQSLLLLCTRKMTHDCGRRDTMPTCNKRGRDKIAVFLDDGMDFTFRHSLVAFKKMVFLSRYLSAILTAVPSLPIDIGQVGENAT